MNVSRRNVIGGGLALAAVGLIGSESRAVAAAGKHLQDITKFRLADGSFVQVNSSSDQSSRIREAFRSSTVSAWYFPAGRYLLRNRVDVSLTKHLVVHCDPDAVFDSRVNGDTFRLRADGGDAGVDVVWDGGRFDSTRQPVSQVVPWREEYPPPPSLELGADAERPSALLTFSPTPSAGGFFGHISVTNTVMTGHQTTLADGTSAHYWELAGGDTGVLIGSCQSAYVAMNSFLGMRDLGVYLTSSRELDVSDVTIADNKFIGCAHGAAIKRGGERFTVVRNQFTNCVRGFLSETAGTGGAGSYIVVSGNEFDRCWESVKLAATVVARVEGNRFANLGHERPNGAALDRGPFSSNRSGSGRLSSAVVVNASVYVVVRNNEVAGVHSSWAGHPATAVLVEGAGNIAGVEKNWVYDVDVLAVERPGEGTNVLVASNFAGAGVDDFVPVNPASRFVPLQCP